VFAASNFPLAFSVAGGDTAAAFAAGCPVVAKAHHSHLGTSELVGRVIQKAVADSGLPEGVFSLLVGSGNTVGQALVRHPAIQAVAFTGSRRGGQALMATAAARPVPIPVFAEMSSTNPVFLLPEALAVRGGEIAADLVASATLGVGQFCTKPGLVVGIAGPALEQFSAAAAAALEAANPGVMLNSGIHKAYAEGTAKLRGHESVQHVAEGKASSNGSCSAQAMLFATSADALLRSAELAEEVFGPASMLVSCKNEAEMFAVAESLEGQLTATLHLADEDLGIAQRLLPILERKAGRILVNGFPTGVEVSYAMVHGGPYPSTSDSRVTSVGAMSIERFLRPVCYQNFPDGLLPEALRADNPLSLSRLVDGKLVL
jgi:NADP-dependent aldehyde dehydrogenase